MKPKLKLCKVCHAPFLPSRSTQIVCSWQHAIEYAGLKADKKAAADARVEAKATREAKVKAKTRAQWTKEAQAAFNKYIRQRDMQAGHHCISSGRPLNWNGNAVDAGHYRSVGSAPHLRFHEDNCWAQSKQDNRYGSGAVVEYRIGLIARIGITRVETLEADQTTKKYTIDDLKEIIVKYKEKTKQLAI